MSAYPQVAIRNTAGIVAQSHGPEALWSYAQPMKRIFSRPFRGRRVVATFTWFNDDWSTVCFADQEEFQRVLDFAAAKGISWPAVEPIL